MLLDYFMITLAITNGLCRQEPSNGDIKGSSPPPPIYNKKKGKLHSHSIFLGN